MKTFPSTKIRNVALVGHGGAGKTTLAEALLACAGAIPRAGRVEDGTATTDHEPEEHRRRISLSTGLAHLEWDGHKINILDCPGFGDFLPEVRDVLRVADLAVFVVSAVEGVEVGTELAWRCAEEFGVPRMIFVGKLDRERASFDRTLEQLRSVFGDGVAPVELPIGEESSFHGVADLLTDTAITYDDGSGTGHPGPIPPEMEAKEHEVHDALVEGIVVADDQLMERYLEGEPPSVEELEHTLAHAVAAGQAFPVVCGSATTGIGVDRLASLIVELGPSPVDRPPVEVRAGDGTADVPCDPDGEPLAYVFKTTVDPYVGKVSVFRVLSGTLRGDQVLVNPRTRHDERLHGMFVLCGKEHEPVSEVTAGDIAAVPKLGDVSTGDTLAAKGSPVVVPPPPRPEPALTIAIRPKGKADEDKLMTALHRLQEEDRYLHVRRDDETHQTLLGGTGETHLAVAAERLARKLSVEVEVEDVRVAYRETIAGTAEAEGRYKKQTGGHGQFGVARLRVEPLPRGEGFAFVDAVVGGAIPRQLIPAVERGVQEAMAAGGLHGFPVVDVRVTCVDGKHHPVDSSEMSFKMAGSLGFREALAAAGSVILEPISRVEVVVPMAQQGDVLGDLNARRGRVQGTDQEGGDVRITAMVPTSEILRYAVDLRSLTGGRGTFRAVHDHHDVLPAHLHDRARAGAAGRADAVTAGHH